MIIRMLHDSCVACLKEMSVTCKSIRLLLGPKQTTNIILKKIGVSISSSKGFAQSDTCPDDDLEYLEEN